MALIPSPLRRGGIVAVDASNPDWRVALRRGGIVAVTVTPPVRRGSRGVGLVRGARG